MTTPLWCLIAFAAWAIFLVILITFWRSGLVLAGKKRANEFPSGTQHGGDIYWRINRAHANAVENLPIVATVILTATIAGARSDLIDTAAIILICARVAQSLFHISSGSATAVSARFTAFMTQVACLLAIIVEIVRTKA